LIQPQLAKKKSKPVEEQTYWGHFDALSKQHGKEYGPCKLDKPKLAPFTHQRKNPVNVAIDKLNLLVMMLFKQKIKIEEAQVVNLLRFFNVPIPRGHGSMLDMSELKKPDFLYTINIKLMTKLFKTLNYENRQMKPEQGSQYYRFYVGVGNNHPSVRQIIKRRSWWHREKQERFIGQGSAATTVGDDDEDEDDYEDQGKGAHFIWTQWKKTELTDHLKLCSNSGPKLMYNKMEDNYHLANKKALFMNISMYYRAMGLDPFEVAIPLTFHIKSSNDPEYLRFERVFKKNQQEKGSVNAWIIKPGENTNRGQGI
jgi:hypothetical protein